MTIADFPFRGKKTFLTVRRRYWQVEGEQKLLKRDINFFYFYMANPTGFAEQLTQDRLLQNSRFARGEITEAEMAQYWQNPQEPLFEHKITPKISGADIQFSLRALTFQLLDSSLASVADAWSSTEFAQMSVDLRNFLEQRKRQTPSLLNLEYYVATDTHNKPFATVGLYSYDIQGGAGLATKSQLDAKEHSLITGLSWFSINKIHQGTGIGKFLLEWVENMAKHRGTNLMFIETDDDTNTTKARRLYRKAGYQQGFDILNYFGPGRDLATYWINVYEGSEEQVPAEKITRANQAEVLRLAERMFSPVRFQEFEVVLELLLQQPGNQPAILEGDSLVIRDQKGQIESFAILSKGSYANQADIFWDGADPAKPNSHEKLILAVKSWVRQLGKDILIVSREGQDDRLGNLGFHDAKQGIPGVFAKGTDTKFLLYSKKLS